MERFAIYFVFFTCQLPALHAACPPEWNYRDFKDWNSDGMCFHTSDQSPINIDTSHVQVPDGPALKPLAITAGKVFNAGLQLNEHTWQVNTNTSASVTWNEKKFDLVQFHFHAPSEHTVDGKHYDMEMHLVHSSPDQQILVVGFFLQVGSKSNPYFDKFWNDFPSADGNKPVSTFPDPYVALMPSPEDVTYYHYTGSLTTPPCTNDTVWILVKEPLTVSSEQVTKYRSGINAPECTQLAVDAKPPGVSAGWDTSLGTNNREIQKLGSRIVSIFNPDQSIFNLRLFRRPPPHMSGSSPRGIGQTIFHPGHGMDRASSGSAACFLLFAAVYGIRKCCHQPMVSALEPHAGIPGYVQMD